MAYVLIIGIWVGAELMLLLILAMVTGVYIVLIVGLVVVFSITIIYAVVLKCSVRAWSGRHSGYG